MKSPHRSWSTDLSRTIPEMSRFRVCSCCMVLTLKVWLMLLWVIPVHAQGEYSGWLEGKSTGDVIFDYIIVGGGVSGLVVANRLSEDPNTSVLVLERGDFANGARAIVPWWANSLDTSLLLSPTSAPVINLGNETFQVTVPSVVGGGSVVNGMAYARGSKSDYDAWEQLGNTGWGWDGLLPYFKKGTTFDPPSPASGAEWNITWNPSVYGDGPLHITIPEFQYPDQAAFWDVWNNVSKVPKPGDPNQGSGPGAFWTPSTIDDRDRTRATARKAYYDPVFRKRGNLQLLTQTTVTEILFKRLHAVGVRISSSASNTTREVYATKEVVLAAGAIQTPQLLQVSGVGPRSVLKAAGIKVKKDLPGVGANLQDHVLVFMQLNLTNPTFPNPNSILTNGTYNATVWNEYLTNKTGPIAGGSSDMTTFLSLPQVTPNSSSIAARYATQNPALYLPLAYEDPSLLRGYRAQQQILARTFASNTASVVGQPFPGSGSSPNPFLKPVSRGTVTLDTKNAHSSFPIVQYNTLSNPVDKRVTLAIVRNARAFWSRPELSYLGPVEIVPGAQYQTDEEILAGLIEKGVIFPSLAHPCGTCAMMPERLGGCVEPDLRVYGVQGLSVVDASVVPLIPGAPLQSTVYAVAEKAADLIKARV